MPFLLFKIPSKILDSVLEELRAIPIPHTKDDIELVNFRIFKTRKPRVSEVSVDIGRIPLMISLRQSWEEYDKLTDYLDSLSKEVSEKVLEIMTKHKARLRNWKAKYPFEGSKWVQLA